MRYAVYRDAEGKDRQWIQMYPDGRERRVEAGQDELQRWLAAGGDPEVREYVPRPRPVATEAQRRRAWRMSALRRAGVNLFDYLQALHLAFRASNTGPLSNIESIIAEADAEFDAMERQT